MKEVGRANEVVSRSCSETKKASQLLIEEQTAMVQRGVRFEKSRRRRNLIHVAHGGTKSLQLPI